MRRLLRRRESEGLSYAQLARETGIPVGTLAWWSHRLRIEGTGETENAGADFVEVIPAGDYATTAEIEIALPSGIQVRAPATADRTTLVRLLTAILSC